MKKIILDSLCILVLILIFPLFAPPVLARGDDPRIEISSERLTPGSVLDIRGVDFEFEEEVTLTLVGSQIEIPFGTVLANAEGIFLLTIVLPTDLKAGTYVIRAQTDDHLVESPQLTIWGTADLGGGEEAVEEDDSLLVAIPTAAPNVPTPLLSSATQLSNVPQPETSFVPYVWIAAGIGMILMLGLLLRGRKS